MEAIGDVKLVLDSSVEVTLKDVFYVSSFRRNLISFSALLKLKYLFIFRMM